MSPLRQAGRLPADQFDHFGVDIRAEPRAGRWSAPPPPAALQQHPIKLAAGGIGQRRDRLVEQQRRWACASGPARCRPAAARRLRAARSSRPPRRAARPDAAALTACSAATIPAYRRYLVLLAWIGNGGPQGAERKIGPLRHHQNIALDSEIPPGPEPAGHSPVRARGTGVDFPDPEGPVIITRSPGFSAIAGRPGNLRAHPAAGSDKPDTSRLACGSRATTIVAGRMGAAFIDRHHRHPRTPARRSTIAFHSAILA